VPEILDDSIISRTLYADDHVKVVVFGFATGQELSEHTSSQPAIIEFVQGEAIVTLGDDVHHARPGTWIHMAPKTPHKITATSPVIMLLTLLRSGAVDPGD
jgi:quercetin dioxygenase-like cupin family protein